MKYIKSQKLFEAFSEEISNNPIGIGNIRNNINDILIELEDKGFTIEYNFTGFIQPVEFITSYSKFSIQLDYNTDESFNFNDIKYQIEHLISYLNENKYRLSFIETSLFSEIGTKFSDDNGIRSRGTNIKDLSDDPTAVLADYIKFYFRHETY